METPYDNRSLIGIVMQHCKRELRIVINIGY